MNSDELKRMSKGFMRKDGKFFLPVTHESLVIDNNGTNIKEKYMLKTDLSIYATEEFVKDYVLRAQLGGSEAVDLSRFAKADHNHDDKYAAKDFEHTHENKAVLDEITLVRMNTWDSKSDFSGSYKDLTDKPEIPSIEGLATQEFVETRIKEAAKPNFNFKLNLIAPDQEAYVTTTGEYPDFFVTFNIPSNNGTITPEPEALYMYYGRISWEEIGSKLIQYDAITADMIKTAANVQKVEVSTMDKTSLGLEKDTVMGDYCIIAVPTSKKLKVTRDNGFGGKTVFEDEDAGANGNVQLIIDNIQYDLYGEILVAPAELFFYIDE